MKRYVIALLVALLAGCAGSQYGVYAPLDTANSARLAIDASNVLPRVYAPSVTRLNVQQRSTDDFGNTLVRLLRQKGYAVSESPYYWSSSYSAPKAPGFAFNYVIDQVGENQCRLTLVVEGNEISRMYNTANGMMTPVGFWAKKE